LSRVVVLIGGPIASGKSTLARGAAHRLREAGTFAAAVDIDLVYELLEERGRSPGEPEVWRKAHRLAGRITDALFEEGVEAVFVEGDFLTGDADEELLATARPERIRRVCLRSSLATAAVRVELDDDRGISRDQRFLARHYEEIAPVLALRPTDELVICTDELTVDETSDRVAAWLQGEPSSPLPG
jgi:hypothetical protein